MTDPGTENGGDEDLSPTVREIVATVRARAGRSASADQIRALAAEAAQHARGNIHTLAEIRDLADVANDRLGKISDLLARLADLAEDEPGAAE